MNISRFQEVKISEGAAIASNFYVIGRIVRPERDLAWLLIHFILVRIAKNVWTGHNVTIFITPSLVMAALSEREACSGVRLKPILLPQGPFEVAIFDIHPEFQDLQAVAGFRSHRR